MHRIPARSIASGTRSCSGALLSGPFNRSFPSVSLGHSGALEAMSAVGGKSLSNSPPLRGTSTVHRMRGWLPGLVKAASPRFDHGLLNVKTILILQAMLDGAKQLGQNYIDTIRADRPYTGSSELLVQAF